MTEKPKSHGRLKVAPTLKPRALMEGTPELVGAWEARIVTLFPDAFPGVLGESLTGRALDAGRWRLRTTHLREFGEGKHRNVDDTPAGGGAGMVLRADVLARAIDATQEGAPSDRTRWPLVYLSPRGKRAGRAGQRRLDGRGKLLARPARTPAIHPPRRVARARDPGGVDVGASRRD